MKSAIYPGSFDPMHEGHIEIVQKACELFDKLYIVVTKNINKNHKDLIENRVIKVKEQLQHFENVEVMINENRLTGDIAKDLEIKYLVRGLRDSNDLKYEIELADANKMYHPEIETIFFVSSIEKRNISSTLLKELEHYKEIDKEK